MNWVGLTDPWVFKHRVGLCCWGSFHKLSVPELPIKLFSQLCQGLAVTILVSLGTRALQFTGLVLEAAGPHPTHPTLGLTTLHTAPTQAALDVPE